MRHECEALQEENVHLQSECERLSKTAVELQCRSADSGDAQADADKDWRLRSDHEHGLHHQLSPITAGTSSIGIVTEGFILPHDVDQLQERVRELERTNQVLRSMHRSPNRSDAGSDQDICEGGFIDDKLRREASQTRTVTSELFVHDSPTDRASPLFPHEDGNQSPLPSPDGALASTESHSPAYERLKAEFIAYKQKAQKDYTKLKARLVLTVRENNDLKSTRSLSKSPSPSPVFRSPPVSPVSDMLVLPQKGKEENDAAVRKHSTSDRHCREKGVQTDCHDDYAADSRADDKTVEFQPFEVIRDTRSSSEMDSEASMRDHCNVLEEELSALRSQYSAQVQQNRSLAELIASLQEAAKKPQQPSVSETPAAVASDGFAVADTSDTSGGSYRDVIAENRRLRQAWHMDRNEYEAKLQQLEERCVQENERLKQLLYAVRTGAEQGDDVGDGDLSASCRHCAELAEKCRMLETSVELSSLVAEQRLHEAEESRELADDLQSRLHQLSEDDGNMVSKACASSSNSFGYVVDSTVDTNVSVADRRDFVCDGVIIDNTVSSTDRSALPVGIVNHNLVEQCSHLPGNDVDLEVAEILECDCENTVLYGNSKCNKSVADDSLSSSFNLHEGLNDRDRKMSYGCQHSGELHNSVLLQAQHQITAVHESRHSVVEACGNQNKTESSDTYLEVSDVVPEQFISQQLDPPVSSSIDEIVVKIKPQMSASSPEKKMTKMSSVTSMESSGIQRKLPSGEASDDNASSVKDFSGSRLTKKPRSSSSPNVLESCEPYSLKQSDTTASRMLQVAKSSVVDGNRHKQVKEDVVKPSNPSQVTSSAGMLENVTRLASQNEEMLRRNRAWTDKLKREYAVTASELSTMKSKYEAIVCDKEKVQAHLWLAQQDINSSGSSEPKQTMAGGRAAVKNDDTSSAGEQKDSKFIHITTSVSSPEIAEMKMQCEMLLRENNELYRKFEAEPFELLKKLEVTDRSVEVTTLQDADAGDQAVKLQEVSHQLMDLLSRYRAVEVENSNLRQQLGIVAGLHADFNYDPSLSAVRESCAENVRSNPADFIDRASSSVCHEKLVAHDAGIRSGQTSECEEAASVAEAAALHEMLPPAVGLSHQDQVSTTRTQSSRSLPTDPRLDNRVTDELHSVMMNSTCTSLEATSDASVALSSNVYLELELLQLEKMELCASLETEEQKSTELRQQHSELANSMKQLEERSGELERQLSDARIQLEIVFEEKRELCRRCEELSAQLEASRMTQTEFDGEMQDPALMPDNSTDADIISDITGNIVRDRVVTNDADISLSLSLGSQQSALKVLELEAALECNNAEKFALQKKLEDCEEEHRCALQDVEQLQGIIKSSEDSLHAAVNKVQELSTANSALEVTNTALTTEVDALKCCCSSLKDEASRLSNEAASLRLELESVNHDKELLSQCRDELLSERKNMQQSIELLREENVGFWAAAQDMNERNEQLSVKIADVNKELELVLRQKEELSAANSAVEYSKCLLEEQCSKSVEKLRQLELAETKTEQQYSADLQNVHLALEHKERECSKLLEESEAAKLSAELNALKLHDCLKCSEQQLEQLAAAEAVVRDFEKRLCEKENELRSVEDLRAEALAAVDEAALQSIALRRENETVSAALCEARAEKNQFLAESQTKVKELEIELLEKMEDISSLREKALQMEATNKQLSNELQSVNKALHEIKDQAREEKVLCEMRLEQLEEEHAALKVVCGSHLAELEKVMSKCTSTELQLSSLKTENKSVVQELQQARQVIQQHQDLVNSLSNEYQQYKDDAEKQLIDIRAVTDGLADNLAECRQEKKMTEEKLDQFTGKFETCEREMAALTAEIDIFKQCNDELKSKIASCQKSEENLAGELEELRTKHVKSCALHRTEIDEQKQMALQAEAERQEMRRIHEQSCQVIDETITKYNEIEAQLSQLRQTNNMMVNDLDKSNQRCKVVSDENERLLSENRKLADSLASKTAEIGLLVVENNAVEARSIKQSLGLQSLEMQLTELNNKESALVEEIKELKCTNSQLHLELEQNQQLFQKLNDTCTYTEEIKSELDKLKTAHKLMLDREEMLTEENGQLIASRDETMTELQSETQNHQRKCEYLTSQISEMEALVCASRNDIVSLQLQKQDVESSCKFLHDCIASCISEASQDVTVEDTEIDTEDAMPKEISKNDVENLQWLQVQISGKNNKLQRLNEELRTCRESLVSEQSLRSVEKESIQKLSAEYEQLKDELSAARSQLDETKEQYAAAVSQLEYENKRLSEDHRTMCDLHSSAQQNVTILTDKITTVDLALQQLEDENVEIEKRCKMRDSEFTALMGSYNILAAEKNTLETGSQLLLDQLESLQKEQIELSTQLKTASVSNSALEEKLSQVSQECTEHCIKIVELEESLSRQDSQNKKFADMLEYNITLFNSVFQAITSISQKCQSDFPDVASTQKVNPSHTEDADDFFNQYSDVLSSLELISNCYRQMTEEQNQQKEKICALVIECDFLKAQASVDVSVEVGLQELQDEVARLFQAKTDLENEIMQLRAENMEAKDTQEHREVEIAAEREACEQKMTDLHHLLDMASQSKEALETELLCERNEFERNLAAARSESLLRAGRSEEEQRKIVEQLSDAESQLSGLRDRLRASQDERDLLQLRLAYITRECTVKEHHVDDLRAQVAAQRAHIEESMKEHRETIQLLVELRLEQQLGRREQRGEFSRLEEEILRLESHIGSCSSRVSTPQTDSVIDTPVSCQPSSVHLLPADSASKKCTDESDLIPTLQPTADDLAYKALETKHFQLVEELSQLKQQLLDLQEVHQCTTDENAMLKQHVESKAVPLDSSYPDSASLYNIHEHRSSFEFPRGPYRAQSCEQFSSVGSAASLASLGQRAVCINIPVEMVSLQAKLVRLQKDNHELVDENKELRTSLLAKQDELMKQMELVCEKQKKRSFRFSSSHSSENMAAMTEISGQQIQLLQKERDELRCRLDAERVKEDDIAKLSDQLRQLEGALSKERQKFHELFQEKESVEIQLMQEQLTVEKHVREFQRLQGLLTKKNRLEQQIRKTNPESTTSAGTHHLLQDKKSQLVVEIRRKILYRDVALQVGESSFRSVRRTTQMMSVQPVVKRVPQMSSEKSLRLDCGCVTELGTMRMRTGCRYHQAVERLRRELKAQDAAACKTQPCFTGKHAGTR